jgi:hypothetical protein
MLGNMLLGIFLGFIASLLFLNSEGENKGVLLILLSILPVAFILWSAGWGVIYGLMAVGELGLGFALAEILHCKIA